MRSILVSNDVNLINKAKICNLEALNFKNLKTNLITHSFENKNILNNNFLKDDYVSGQKESLDPLLEKFVCTIVNFL